MAFDSSRMDRYAGHMQAGQQYSPYGCGMESEILGVWRIGFRTFQSDRYVQLLAKVFDDAIHLIIGHVFEPSAYQRDYTP